MTSRTKQDRPIINYKFLVTEQIQRICRVRSQGQKARNEIIVLDELLDCWRDSKFEAFTMLMENGGTNGLQRGGISLEGIWFRELVNLAKRKNLLDVEEEVYF